MGALSSLDRSNLRKLETTIAKGMETFFEVGLALKRIRDEQLYRGEHKTFEAYVQARWKLSRSRAYQLIESADVNQNVHHGRQNSPSLPNERAARELARLPAEEQADTWDEVVATTPNPTHKDVQKHVDRKLGDVVEATHVRDVTEEKPKSRVDEALENAEQAREVQRAIQTAIRLTNAITDKPGLELLASKQKSIVTHLENAKSAVTVSIPVDVCPRCKGEGCSHCGNFGWINSLLKNA